MIICATKGEKVLFIISARKRSLGKVMFSESFVCPNRRRGLCMMSLPVWLPGAMFLLGSLSLVPCSFQGSLSRGSLSRDLCQGRPPLGRDPHGTVKSGQYASYCNALLFI